MARSLDPSVDPPAVDHPATPDFGRYEWHAVTDAHTADDWVHCRWPDGTVHRFYGLWLWENAVGRGTDPTTREMTLDPGDLPEPPVVGGVAVDADGALIVTWSVEDHKGVSDRIHPGWLRSIGDGNQTPRATLPPQQQWTIDDWAAQPVDNPARIVPPPSVDGSDVLDDDAALAEWISLVVSYGVARLVNAPTDLDFLDQLSERVGPIRATNFGRLFSVRSVVEPTAEENSLANTGLKLGQHTDLPTRETPPGFQVLHCIQNTVPGGWATFTDGAALTQRLRTGHPDDYDALTTLEWTFANRSPDADHRWTGPMIELASNNHPLTLRCFYPVRAYPAMDEADVPRAYAAMRTFSRLSQDPAHTMRFPYAPGDVVIFDNRRALHGRDAFDPGGGERHLRGCYYDHDDVYSRLRVLRRTAPTTTTDPRPHPTTDSTPLGSTS